MNRPGNRERLAAARDPRALALGDRPAPGLGQRLLQLRLVARRDELPERPADRGLVTVTEPSRERHADAVRTDPSLLVDDGEHARRRAADRDEEVVLLTQLLLLEPSLSDVDSVDQPPLLARLVEERCGRPRDEAALARRRDPAVLVLAPGDVCCERLSHGLGVLGGDEEFPEEPTASVLVVLAAGERDGEIVEACDPALRRDDAEDAPDRVHDRRQEVALKHHLMLRVLAVGDVAVDREHLVLAALHHPDLAVSELSTRFDQLRLDCLAPTGCDHAANRLHPRCRLFGRQVLADVRPDDPLGR